jgi:molybdopterin-guanine dinucleotide biosynthesis protein A/HD superfamily phosphodiesterase
MAGPQGKRIQASCLILAGGQGKRLTPDKPLLQIDGRSVIERVADVVAALFAEVIVVTNTPEKYGFLGLAMVADERQGCGPLMGIYSGLRKIRHEVAFVCAADMPFLNEEVILAQFNELGGFDIVAPCPQRRPEFLHAVYHKRCLPAIKENLDAELFKMDMLSRRCNILLLDEGWFLHRGLMEKAELAFTNINTVEDYRSLLGQGQAGQGRDRAEAPPQPRVGFGLDALKLVTPEVLSHVRQTLIGQESAFQNKAEDGTYSSLWGHSSRVGRIAHHIAKMEGLEPEPALLAGLLHDTGKFAHGRYHEDDIPEEVTAVAYVQQVLSRTSHEQWIPIVCHAITSMYLDVDKSSDIGRVAYDADSLDKLGCMGVAQFFAKNALRRRFLDHDLVARASIELTYAHHAPDMLKTVAGRSLARERNARTRRFYADLLEEWGQLGLGAFNIVEEDIGGIICLMVVPGGCSCGGGLDIQTDIRDALKCRSVLVKYSCRQCGGESDYSFCLPNVKGLPPKG